MRNEPKTVSDGKVEQSMTKTIESTESNENAESVEHDTERAKRRVMALGIEYKGTAFCGWQVQPDQPSVQAELEAALERFLCVKTPTICAGRTDTGVHATHQVVSFETEADRPESNWVRGLNTFLSDNVSVRWARVAPADFHARFSATSRTYEYWILNDRVRSPLFWSTTGWVFRPLDVERMRAGAACLLGTHDFTSFRAAECQAATPVRTIKHLDIVRLGRFVGIRISANAFLQHMVRNIVGTLIYVGTSRESPEWVERVLAAKCRAAAAPTFSPCGLYLTGVGYEGEAFASIPQGASGPFGNVFPKH